MNLLKQYVALHLVRYYQDSSDPTPILTLTLTCQVLTKQQRPKP